jgi:anaerobic dimethyl sulfoxide reductase subunit B (iron-sulfur subunit)
MVPNNVFAYLDLRSLYALPRSSVRGDLPTTAMSKDENGVVTIDADKCVGCRYCEWVCPYSAPQFDEAAGIMTKCNMCQDPVLRAEIRLV